MEEQDTPLTEAEANELLKKLSDFFGEPVIPVSRYMETFRQWVQAIQEGALRERDEEFKQELLGMAKTLREALSFVQKSSLLFRLVHVGEKLRSRPCPLHNGRWSGIAQPEGFCPYGCTTPDGHITGWLPEPS